VVRHWRCSGEWGVAGCCANLVAESEWDALTRKQRGFFRPAPQERLDPDAWGPSESAPVDAVGMDDFDLDVFDSAEIVERRQTPSLPIILFSAACGVSGGVIALFISFRWLQWGVELSAGVATLALLFSLGISGAILSAATGSRAAPINILFSCGVILLAMFFLALCLLGGALFGTVLVRL
jgi:hypothetical protein